LGMECGLTRSLRTAATIPQVLRRTRGGGGGGSPGVFAPVPSRLCGYGDVPPEVTTLALKCLSVRNRGSRSRLRRARRRRPAERKRCGRECLQLNRDLSHIFYKLPPHLGRD
jgi:hypothetical protein